MTISKYLRDQLVDVARVAAKASYSPYSKFPVGVALLAADGRVFTGCNIENASYGLTRCAEQVALGKAVSEGSRAFLALVVVSRDAVTPCGACRQMLSEFCNASLPVFMAKLKGDDVKRTTLGKLFPDAFKLK